MERGARTALKQQMISRICGEYLEMPGLGLKREQARRLWQVDDEFCGELLDFLVETQFLRRRSDGRYVRAATAPESVTLYSTRETEQADSLRSRSQAEDR